MRAALRAAVAGVACSLVTVGVIGVAPAAGDVFGPISLVSEGQLDGGALQQAEYAHDTAISENGHYVAFDGSVGGVSGVWRRDLQTGALEEVAGGDAELPSLSEDGQFISFTTNEGANLPKITDGEADSEPQPEAVNVYVRDMSKAPSEPGAFILASAANGSEEGLNYLGAGINQGAVAAGRSAISANGNEVAFVTTAVSDLVRYPALEEEEREKGETPKPHTPALQVAVRYLETRETELVSRCYHFCQEPTEPAVASVEQGESFGAVYPGQEAHFRPAPAYGEYGRSPPVGASVSADGSTVAWIGANLDQQVTLLGQEQRSAFYTEPLWRRIEPGSETPTERVTGGSDPADPECVLSGESALPPQPSASDPCQGPFIVPEQAKVAGILNASGGTTGDFVPRLSANGYTVAFVSQAPLVSLGENFGRGDLGQQSDLYVANVAPGLTRDEALTPLTTLAGGESAGLADTAPIFDFAISPDGNQVAFVTRRTAFPLGSPADVSPSATEPGMNELFDVDLQDDTLTRITHGFGDPGEPAEHPHAPQPTGVDPYLAEGDGALSPSFSADGSVLAFSSTASNLAFGDTNGPPSDTGGGLDGGDAFVVTRTIFRSLPTPQSISPAPRIALEPSWQLGVSAQSRADGSVLLYVDAPALGALRALASSVVPEHVAVHISKRRLVAGRRASSHGRRSRVARSGQARHEAVIRNVAVATQLVGVSSEEPTRVFLRLAKPYAALASQPGGLSATVNVVFNVPGKPTLRQSIPVTFLTASHHVRSGARSRGHGADRHVHRRRRR